MVGGAARRGRGMREVAQVAGVSVSTVANVLNNPTRVAEVTRLRVEDAMARVGFVRNGAARQMRGLPSRVVGTVILDIANPFYSAVSRGICDRLEQAGCLMLSSSTDLDTDKESRTLLMLEEQAVRGIIVTPTGHDLAQLTAISDRGTPVVLVDFARGRLDLCAVMVDDVLSGQMVGEHLIGLGHRRVAFLHATVDIKPVMARRDGLFRALAAAGLDPAEALVELHVNPALYVEAARGAVEGLLSAAPVPTAIVCFNDVAAVGIIHELDRVGLRVPDDVSVVGFDDLPFAALLRPALTTVRRPTYDLGAAATDLLLDEVSPKHQHREVRYQPTLVVRGSTGPPAAKVRPRRGPKARAATS